MTSHVRELLPVKEILERLGRREQALKRCGAFAESQGVRTSVVEILRMADEEQEDEPLEQHGEGE